MPDQSFIILFDGVCNLCNTSVQFIIRHDRHHVFKFASLQSDYAQKLRSRSIIPSGIYSIILQKETILLREADAVLEISKYLGWNWMLLGRIVSIFPRSFRNKMYRIVAKNRYRWFGKKEQCMIPTPDIKNRFLE